MDRGGADLVGVGLKIVRRDRACDRDVNAQTAFTWQDGRYARAQMDRGRADSSAFGRGGAEN